jgi:hypothetical protein
MHRNAHIGLLIRYHTQHRSHSRHEHTIHSERMRRVAYFTPQQKWKRSIQVRVKQGMQLSTATHTPHHAECTQERIEMPLVPVASFRIDPQGPQKNNHNTNETEREREFTHGETPTARAYLVCPNRGLHIIRGLVVLDVVDVVRTGGEETQCEITVQTLRVLKPRLKVHRRAADGPTTYADPSNVHRHKPPDRKR